MHKSKRGRRKAALRNKVIKQRNSEPGIDLLKCIMGLIGMEVTFIEEEIQNEPEIMDVDYELQIKPASYPETGHPPIEDIIF